MTHRGSNKPVRKTEKFLSCFVHVHVASPLSDVFTALIKIMEKLPLDLIPLPLMSDQNCL